MSMPKDGQGYIVENQVIVFWDTSTDQLKWWKK
jgi:hypothetical protein